MTGGAYTIDPCWHNKSESSEKDLKDIHALEGSSPGLPTEGKAEDGTTNNRAGLWGFTRLYECAVALYRNGPPSKDLDIDL